MRRRKCLCEKWDVRVAGFVRSQEEVRRPFGCRLVCVLQQSPDPTRPLATYLHPLGDHRYLPEEGTGLGLDTVSLKKPSSPI